MRVIQDRWWGLGSLNERPAQMAVPLKTDFAVPVSEGRWT